MSGFTFTTKQKLRIKVIEDHIDCLNNQINTLGDIVDDLIKSCLVQVAHNAVKDKTNTYYADKFNKISK